MRQYSYGKPHDFEDELPISDEGWPPPPPLRHNSGVPIVYIGRYDVLVLVLVRLLREYHNAGEGYKGYNLMRLCQKLIDTTL